MSSYTLTCQDETMQMPPITIAHNKLSKIVLTVAVCLCVLGLGACKPKAQLDASLPDAASSNSPAQRNSIEPPVQQAQVDTKPPSGKLDNAPSSKTSEDLDQTTSKSVGIAGGWVNAGGACDSGAAVLFNQDGTYLSEGEKGTWALNGKTLTVTTAPFEDVQVGAAEQGPDESTGDVGEKSVLTVLSITDDAARVVLSNGSNANWTRCNG
jgi:hypothetical protein